MNATPKDRLNQYLKAKHFSLTYFSEICGIEKSVVSRISSTTSQATLRKISENCDLNTDWLLTGEGNMLKFPINEVEDVSKEELECINEGLRNGSFRLVPLINIDSVGGIHSDNITTPSEQYIIRMMPFTEAKEGDIAIIQSGNSMYPTIPPGSALLIREVIGWKEYFGYGGIYVIWLKDGRRITKEIRRYDADPKNYVWCVSYNPDVADEELPKSMIRGVWKVVKYIADFGW